MKKQAFALILDHFDSFTHNLYQMCWAMGHRATIVRYDQLDLESPFPMPERIILSPGPGSPEEYPRSLELLKWAASHRVPVLGICLGHQIIASFLGLKILRCMEVSHGKASPIFHNGTGIFQGIPQGFLAGRYHSLYAKMGHGHPHIKKTAWTQDGLPMGITHSELPMEGIQFHPESVLTEYGGRLMENFLGRGRKANVVP